MKLNKALGNKDIPVGNDIHWTVPATASKIACSVVPNAAALAGYANARGVAPTAAVKVRAVYLVADTVYTGVATNNVTLAIEQWRGGAKVTTIASKAIDNTVTIPAGDAYLLDPGMSSPALSAGDVLFLTTTVNGTGGTAIGGVSFFIDLEVSVDGK